MRPSARSGARVNTHATALPGTRHFAVSSTAAAPKAGIATTPGTASNSAVVVTAR